MATQEFIDPDLATSEHSGDGASTSVRRASSVASPSRVEIDARVEQARQQMLSLRRQQEELEHERQELEELRQREEEFEHGKQEILEELSRTITKIEQEEFETNKQATTLSGFREVFQQYFNQIQDIRENEWAADEIKAQLPKAMTLLDAARAEINKGRAQLSFLEGGPMAPAENPSSQPQSVVAFQSGDPGPFDFTLELKRGFARSLPLFAIGILLLLILLFHGK